MSPASVPHTRAHGAGLLLPRWRLAARLAVAALLWLAAGRAVDARTVLLDAARYADQMAGIDEAAPRYGWAMYVPGYKGWEETFSSASLVLPVSRAALIRFSLASIPAGQRIAHAELVLPLSGLSGTEPRFYLWRLLADWGIGVCFRFRTTYPEKQAWTKPGGRGNSSDRATRPTDIVRVSEVGDLAVNVTEDVDLWYRGAAPNRGWMLTVEDPGVIVTFLSPAWDGRDRWKLRITYEPEGDE